jgi:hypothetical protein
MFNLIFEIAYSSLGDRLSLLFNNKKFIYKKKNLNI